MLIYMGRAANLWVWNKRRYGLDDTRADTIKVVFVNPMDGPVALFWSNTKLATIKAHGEQPFASFHGHRWVFDSPTPPSIVICWFGRR